jgi:hypothetical protein
MFCTVKYGGTETQGNVRNCLKRLYLKEAVMPYIVRLMFLVDIT